MNYKTILRVIIVLILFGFSITDASAQVVQKIGSNSFTINPKAVLELESTTKGFLPPRMSALNQSQISNLGANEKGLIVYVTDAPAPGLQIWDGTKWVAFVDTVALALKADATALAAEVTRATNAESTALVTAATDAKTKADAAIVTAAADASTKADAAQSAAISAAAADASSKASAAQSAAIAIASTDASTKADAAQSAAISAAAADASSKASAAQSAAIAIASTDATTKANTAQSAAISAAAADASSKANTAQSAAIAAAAIDAQTKVDAALAAASSDATAKVLVETSRATAAEVKLTTEKENTANKSTTIALVSNSDVKFPTEKAVIDYVNTRSVISIVAHTSAYTALATDSTILCNTSSAGFKLSLPVASGAIGKIYVIRKTDSSNNALTFDNLTLVDLTTINSLNYPKTIRVQSDGSAWYVID